MTNDPAYLSLTKDMMREYSKLDKRIEERKASSCASSLGPSCAYESSYPRSSSSRSSFFSSIGSKNLSIFHYKPIFDEDVNAHDEIFDHRTSSDSYGFDNSLE